MAIDPLIKKETDVIRNEQWADKVRSSIANGLDYMSEDVVEIDNRQKSLESDFVAVQQDARSNTPSGAELAVAAGEYNTLGERLDAEEQKVAAQLAQTPKKTETGWANLNTFNEETRSTILGMEPGEVNAVLGEGNVQAINTSENLFQSLTKEIKGDSLGHLPTVKDFSPYTIAFVAAVNHLFLINTPLTIKGNVKVRFKSQVANSFYIVLFKKVGTDRFDTTSYELVTTKVGINEIETSLASDGSGSQYIGIMGTEEGKTPSGYTFNEYPKTGNYYSIAGYTLGKEDFTGTLYTARNADIAINFEILDNSIRSDFEDTVKDLIPKEKRRWESKIWNSLGNSITARNWYQPLVCKETGLINVNYGVNGTTVARKNETDTTSFSVRYKDMQNDADLITVWLPINDFGYNFGSNGGIELGEMGDTSDLTFYGAMKVLIEGLLTKYPNETKIGFILTPKIASLDAMNTHSLRYGGGDQPNAKGYYLKQYIDAVIEVCELYSIPFLDLYRTGGMNDFNILKMTSNVEKTGPDGLHPSISFHEFTNDKVVDFIENI